MNRRKIKNFKEWAEECEEITRWGIWRVIEKERGKSRKERSRGDFGIEERKRENEREGARAKSREKSA